MTPRLHFATVVVAFAVASSPLRAQSVFVVAPTLGPGVFSTDIQPAIDAAASGDLVLVRAGTYSGFTIDGKGVSVVADFGASVMTDGVTVRNLTAAQSVLLEGLTMYGGAMTPGLTLQNDAGSVWIEACDALGGTRASASFVGASIVSCASVAIERSVVTGGGGAFTGPLDNGGHGLDVSSSSVALSDSQCIGGKGGATIRGTPGTGAGGHGARILSGNVFASGTTFQGGEGGVAILPLFPGGPGGNGLVTLGAVTSLECAFAGGMGHGGFPAGVPVSIGGAGTLRVVNGEARHFSIASPAREAQPIAFTAGGVAGENVGFLFSASPAAPLLLLPFDGALLLSLAGADALLLGTIPAGGTLATALAAPTLPPTLQSATIYCQSLFFDAPLTDLVIGPASALVILDASL